jgi:hypothetical protein
MSADIRSMLNGREHADIIERIRPMLAGKHPALQSAVVADLAAIWLAGHHRDLREELLTIHVQLIRELVPVEAHILGTEP